MVSGGGSGAGPSSSSGFGQGPTPVPRPQATTGQRKQQLAQLAEMGVSIPDEFRPDMAMAGEWQVTAQRIVEQDGEKKPDAIALGVRKRTVEDEEDAVEAKKLRWGSKFRTHPTEEDNGDLDDLLANATRKDPIPAVKIELKQEVKEEVKEERNDASPEGIKREPSDGETKLSEVIPPSNAVDATIKPEGEEQTGPGVVFKKRKAKNIRQK